eukprot:TRINITY_DN269_c0_g1_i2.p1 TRINITY_DN269_c0_g1~~TRINITY_DN269_c0_g1_i2.p1  ORF type:complete len:658 (-),score=165.09 TRINITY_DN269_c0_g1_i2:70-2043(-)
MRPAPRSASRAPACGRGSRARCRPWSRQCPPSSRPQTLRPPRQRPSWWRCAQRLASWVSWEASFSVLCWVVGWSSSLSILCCQKNTNQQPSTKQKKMPPKTPKKPAVERTSTMKAAAEEGAAFVGEKMEDIVETKGDNVRETRGRKRARETLNEVLDASAAAASKAKSRKKSAGGDAKAPVSAEEREQEAQKLRMVFRLFDRDHNGHLDAGELAAVMRSMGKRPLKKKIEEVFAAADTDKSGTIEIDEFVAFILDSKFEDEHDDAAAATAAAATTVTTATAAATTAAGRAAAVARGKSITEYYTEHAKLHDEIKASSYDAYMNPAGGEYDLGQDGKFGEFTVLILSLQGALTQATFATTVGPALKKKGFSIVFASSVDDFIAKLPSADVAWFLSFLPSENDAKLSAALTAFHKSGGGIFVWTDNDPLFAQANVFLADNFGFTMGGNDPGQKTLTVGDASTAGHFARHAITSGLTNLYEGITVSYPSASDVYTVVARNSSGNAVSVAIESGKKAFGAGRVVVDGGYTKLYANFLTAGTERYITNATVWLLGLEHKLATASHAVPVAGEDVVEGAKSMWQYYLDKAMDGKGVGWHDYEEEAAGVVETAYQDWLKNPYVDVRTVKSGQWSYSIDFNLMTQTNIEHSAHTTRRIRRAAGSA